MMTQPARASRTTMPPATMPAFAPTSRGPWSNQDGSTVARALGSVILMGSVEKMLPSMATVVPSAGFCWHPAWRTLKTGVG
jgi:hypothetical protein